MGRALLIASVCVSLCAAVSSCKDREPQLEAHQRSASYQHGPPPGSPPYPYLLTAYGGPNDSTAYLGTPSCGGKVVDGSWYYSTGAYTYGCRSKLKLAANGKCVVVEVVDNGPAAWVEQKAASRCGGLGYVIDASPLVSQYLYSTKTAGWSDCFAIQVTPVASSTPAGPTSCGTLPPPVQSCGDGKLDSGELCDTAIASGSPGACPMNCDDGNACTSDQLVGSGCQQSCKHSNICPPPTPPPSASCGNGNLDPGEWCDIAIPAGVIGACPTSCDDGDPCTEDRFQASGCLAICSNRRIAGCGVNPGQSRPIGSPCTRNADCMSGQCLPAYAGFAGGMCSQPCRGSCAQPGGEVASACLLLMPELAELGGYCYALCNDAVSSTDCREGYRCLSSQTASGTAQSVCVPETAPPGDDRVDGGCSLSGSAEITPARLLLLILLLLGLCRIRRGR